MRRVLALLLSLSMVLTLAPATGLADETADQTSVSITEEEHGHASEPASDAAAETETVSATDSSNSTILAASAEPELWSLADALPTEGNYKLMRDVHVKAQTVLTGDLTLDLNGHTIYDEKTTGNWGTIRIATAAGTEGISLTLTNGTIDGTSSTKNSFIYINSKGSASSLNTSNVTFQNFANVETSNEIYTEGDNKGKRKYDTSSGRIMNLQGNINVNVADTVFKDSENEQYGAIYMGAVGDVDFTNCTFMNLRSVGYTTAIADSTEVTTTGGQAGAINIVYPATLTNCQFTGCSSTGRAGACYISGVVTLDGCTFENCSCNSNGGAVYLGGAGSEIKNTTFTSNSAVNGSLKDKTATGVGGAIYVLYSPLQPVHTLTNCTFEDNASTYSGGAICVGGASDTNNATIIADGCTFTGNTTEENGSAIIVSTRSYATLKDCVFTGNITAAYSGKKFGGAVYNYNAANYTLEGSTVIKDNYDVDGNAADLLLQGTGSIVKLVNPTAAMEINFKTATTATAGRALATLESGEFIGTYKLTSYESNAFQTRGVELSEGSLVAGEITAHTHVNAKGEETEYLPWSDSTSLPREGNYYLTCDVTVGGANPVTADLNLCLNGHTIYRSASGWLLQIRVNNVSESIIGYNAEAVININDCTGKGGFDGNGLKMASPFIGSTGTGCAGEINCSDIFFRNATGTGAGAPGITVQNGTAATFTNCTFENLTSTSGTGYIIYASGTAERKLIDCEIIACSGTTSSITPVNTTKVKVINDGVEYSAWNKADSLPTSGQYALLGPVTAGSKRLDVAGPLTIDLNGQTITRSAAVGIYNIKEATDVLTVTNSKTAGGVDGAGISSGSAVFMVQGGSVAGSQLNLSNFTISDVAGTANGATITMQGACVSNLTNLTVDNCRNTSGNNGSVIFDGATGAVTIDGLKLTNSGGVYTNGGMTVTNSTFDSCSSNYSGGAINVEGNGVTISDCEFTDNYAKVTGGAIKTIRNITITGCTFTGNNAANGGAINDGSGAVVTIDDCDFNDNYATTNGGAIYITSGKYIITDSDFAGNGINTDGEAVTANGGAIFEQCSVTSGTKAAGGGYLNGVQGSADITGCTFSGNKAKYSAGAVYICAPTSWTSKSVEYTGDATTLTSCTFENNYAATYGGAIRVGYYGSYYAEAETATQYTTNAKAVITDSTFTANECPGNAGGGAIKVYNTASCEVTGCTFTENIGKAGAAVSLNANGSFTTTNGVFENNTDLQTGRYAGAIYAANGSQNITFVGRNIVNGNYNSAAEPVAANIGLQDASAFATVINPTADTVLSFNLAKTRTAADKLGTLQVDAGNEEAAAGAAYTLTGTDNAVAAVNDSNEIVMAHSHDGIIFQSWTDATTLPTSGNYCLDVDVELTGGNYVRGDLNLCLNGHTITYTKGSWFITISTVRTNSQRLDADPDANVFVCNCSEEGGVDGNSVSISGPIIGSTNYNAAGDPLTGSIRVDNVVFKNITTSVQAGAIITQGGTALEVTNCTFENCAGTVYGGAINSIGTADCSISDTVFTNCSCSRASGKTSGGNGGAIYAGASAHSLYVTGCTFDGCKAYNGSAVNLGGSIEAYFEDVTFKNNIDLNAGELSGAIYTTTKAANTHFTGKILFTENYNSAATPMLVGINMQNAEARLVVENLDADSVIPLLSGANAAAAFEILGTYTGEYNGNFSWTEDESKFIDVVDGEIKFVETSTHIHDGITYEAWTKADSLPSSGNYFLTKNVTITVTTKKVNTAVTGELNLCLNGHTITYDATNANITGTTDTSIYGVIRVNNSGKCHLDNCQAGRGGFDGSKAGSTVEGQIGQTALLFTNNKTAEDAEFTVKNISFFGLNNLSARAVVFQGAETSSFTNCTFEGNTGAGQGAAIYATGTGPITIDGCTFKNNTASYAAAIYRSQSADGEYHGTTTICNNTFVGNAATGTSVGAVTVAVNDAKAVITNNTFTGNTGVNGAALRLSGTNTENLISGNTFTGNISGTVTVEETITNGKGAALYFGANSAATVEGNTFKNNEAINLGGAIYADPTASIAIKGNTFSGNKVNTSEEALGADIYFSGSSSAEVFGASTLDSNTFNGNDTGVSAVAVGARNTGVTITGTLTNTREGTTAFIYGSERSAINVADAEFTGFEGIQAISTLGTLNVSDTVSDGSFYIDATANMYQIQMDGMAVVSGDTVASFELSKHTGSTYELGGGEAEKAIISIQGANLGEAAELTVTVPEGDDINDYVFGPAIINATETADTYKITAAFVEPGINIPVTDDEHSYNIVSASLDIAEMLALNFTYESDDEDAYMEFYLDGEKVTGNDIAKSENTYTMKALSPRTMTSTIKAVLLSGEGETKCEIDNYSVVMYVNGLYKNIAGLTDAKSEATKTLLASLLAFGQQSQLSSGYNLDKLPLDDNTWAAAYIKDATQPSSVTADVTAEPAPSSPSSKIKGAGPRFGETISLYFRVQAKNDDTVISIYYNDGDATDDNGYTLWKSGTVAALEEELGSDFERTTTGCKIYIGSLEYSQLGRAFKITVSDSGLVQRSVRYSLNSYISAKWDDANYGPMMQALAGFAEAIDSYQAQP